MSATALQMKPSELLETIAGSRSLLRSVAKEHPTLISHAASVVGDIIAKHRGKTDQRVQRILAQAEANLNYALAQTADENRNVDPGGKINANKRKSAPEGVRFMSIQTLEDGTRYVEVDTDQARFDGLDLASMQKEAKRVILEKFKGKVIG